MKEARRTPRQQSPRLKPCPFCGKRYKGLVITTRGRAERFECPSCGARGPFIQVSQKAGQPQAYYDRLCAQAWNRRSP